MSVDLNIVVLGGRLVSDPVVIGENKGARFTLASNRRFKSNEGTQQESTVFVPITCWNKLGELVIQKCVRGSAVIVEGRLEERKFEGSDGTNKKYFTVIAKDVRFVSASTESVPSKQSEKTLEQLKKLLNKA